MGTPTDLAAGPTGTPAAPRSSRPPRTLAGLVLVGLLGAAAGVGSFTFHYAEGLSYFSKDPAACKNCHIMNPQFDSWQKSSHHTVATCVDCHLPHGLVGKYLAKAENGYFHSKAFTLQDHPEPIAIKARNARILQRNCVDCHAAIIGDMVHGASHAEDAVSCVHCHRRVGHGDAVGMGRWDPRISAKAEEFRP